MKEIRSCPNLSLVTTAFSLTFALAIVQQQASATIVFSADFESAANVTGVNDMFAADVGTLTTSGTTNRVKSTVQEVSDPLDWETKALRIDRNTGDSTHRIDWSFTSPVELAGATVDFDFLIRRGGGAAANANENRSHLIVGYDSNDAEVFQIIMISRADSYANFEDYVGLNENTTDDVRQDKSVGYVDSVNGNSLFAASQIASGSLPDTKSKDVAGAITTTGLYGGNDGPDVTEAAGFAISLSATGWTLAATPSPNPDGSAPGLAAFTTTEIPFFDAGVVDLARIEVNGFSEQAGAYWDNLEVAGTLIPEPTGAALIATFVLAVCGVRIRKV